MVALWEFKEISRAQFKESSRCYMQTKGGEELPSLGGNDSFAFSIGEEAKHCFQAKKELLTQTKNGGRAEVGRWHKSWKKGKIENSHSYPT